MNDNRLSNVKVHRETDAEKRMNDRRLLKVRVHRGTVSKKKNE